MIIVIMWEMPIKNDNNNVKSNSNNKYSNQ
jgi:hypothetical protein